LFDQYFLHQKINSLFLEFEKSPPCSHANSSRKLYLILTSLGHRFQTTLASFAMPNCSIAADRVADVGAHRVGQIAQAGGK
jgi:hypothetical protein